MSSSAVEVVFSLSAIAAEAEQPPNLFSYSAGPAKVPGPWKRGRPKKTSKQPVSLTLSSKPRFEFINVSGTSGKDTKDTKTVQARIRSHARRNSAKPFVPAPAVETEPQQQPQATMQLQEFRPNLHQIFAVDPFDAQSARLDPQTHDYIKFFMTVAWRCIYTLELSAGFNPFTEYWLPMGFTDSAMMHTFVGCADSFISYMSNLEAGSRPLWHLTRAISIVNQRLAAATESAPATAQKPITGCTLAMVAGIALFEENNGNHHHWKLHMQGLSQLMRYFGGFKRLYDQPMIAQKIFRADLYGAISADEPPIFDTGIRTCRRLAELSSTRITTLHSADAFRSNGFARLSQAFSVDATIVSCIRTLEESVLFWDSSGGFISLEASHAAHLAVPAITAAAAVASVPKRPTVEAALLVRHLLFSVQYMLISRPLRRALAVESAIPATASSPFAFLTDADANVAHNPRLGELCRIALLLFSFTVLNERPVGIVYGLALIRKLRMLLQEEDDDALLALAMGTAIPQLPIDLQLWAVFLVMCAYRGGCMSLDKMQSLDDTAWLLDAFCSRLVLLLPLSMSPSSNTHHWNNHLFIQKNFGHAQQHLRQYLWVPIVHDKLLQLLWDEGATATNPLLLH